MTVHARGYRPFTGVVRPRRLRFLTIFRQGYADAARGIGFRIFQVIVLIIFVIIAIILNFQVGLADLVGSRTLDPAADLAIARGGLATALMMFHTFALLPTMLLSLFVGAGLVADDLRTRALPLYLVRPLTPLDYFLGKWLVPFVVLGIHVLLPSLLLVLMAGLLRPSGESAAFFAEQGDIVRTLLLHFVVVAVTYSSVVLLVSAASRRRGAAIVMGALVFIGGSIVAGICEEMEGTAGDVARSLSPAGNPMRVLFDGIASLAPTWRPAPAQSVDAAYVAAGVLLAACAFVVIRRARTTEVVS